MTSLTYNSLVFHAIPESGVRVRDRGYLRSVSNKQNILEDKFRTVDFLLKGRRLHAKHTCIVLSFTPILTERTPPRPLGVHALARFSLPLNLVLKGKVRLWKTSKKAHYRWETVC